MNRNRVRDLDYLDFGIRKVERRRLEPGDIVRDAQGSEYEVMAPPGMKLVHVRPVGGGAERTLFIRDIILVPKAEPQQEEDPDAWKKEFNY